MNCSAYKSVLRFNTPVDFICPVRLSASDASILLFSTLLSRALLLGEELRLPWKILPPMNMPDS